jgi:transcriptional regulator with XRE-family HTH domain
MICPKCGGTGQMVDPGDMRRLRLASGKSLREVADQMGISPAYLSDLERGNRQWNGDLAGRFLAAVEDER